MRVFLKFIYFLSIIFFQLKTTLCYSSDFTKETIIFYAKKEFGSNEYIARKGVLVKRPNALATVIILHGYGNNKLAVAPFRILFRNFNCLTFDFRAHGEEIDDQCSTVGHDEIFDLYAAVDYAKSQPDLKDKPILIWAPSMGASTAIEAQALDSNLCIGMILDAPFPSSQEIIKKGVSQMKLGKFASNLLEKYAFNEYIQPILKYLLKKIAALDATKIDTFVKPIFPIESIKKIKVPCLFVVCKNDEKISVASVKSIYENHQGPKRLWITNGPDHCGTVLSEPEKYEKIANEFFNSILNKSIFNQPKEMVILDNEE